MHSHDIHAELFYLLARRNERQGVEILRQIQRGHSPEAVLRFIKEGDIDSVVLDPRRPALNAFLVTLAHSTGSLRDVIGLARSVLGPTRTAKLPNPDDYLMLRNRIVHLPCVETVLRESSPLSDRLLLSGAANPPDKGPHPGFGRQSNPVEIEDGLGSEDDPPYRVPQAPWISITASDEAVSHLVSLFLAWINPTWRFVEQDLFLSGK